MPTKYIHMYTYTGSGTDSHFSDPSECEHRGQQHTLQQWWRWESGTCEPVCLSFQLELKASSHFCMHQC